MKFSLRAVATISLLLVASSQSVWAHDPAEHAKEAAAKKAKADCSSMQKMDISKMDMSKMNMDDPVMQAMHAKCAKQAAQKAKVTNKNTAKGQANMEMDHSKMEMDHSKMNMPATTTTTPDAHSHQ